MSIYKILLFLQTWIWCY